VCPGPCTTPLLVLFLARRQQGKQQQQMMATTTSKITRPITIPTNFMMDLPPNSWGRGRVSKLSTFCSFLLGLICTKVSKANFSAPSCMSASNSRVRSLSFLSPHTLQELPAQHLLFQAGPQQSVKWSGSPIRGQLIIPAVSKMEDSEVSQIFDSDVARRAIKLTKAPQATVMV